MSYPIDCISDLVFVKTEIQTADIILVPGGSHPQLMDKARHTFGNAEFSWKVIKENKLSVKKVILVCKAYHSRRALLTYQSIFPKDIEFFVVAIPGKKEIREDNWFMDEEKIKTVMGEVVKIGKYFEPLIKKFQVDSDGILETSRALPKKYGFKEEGIIRDSE